MSTIYTERLLPCPFCGKIPIVKDFRYIEKKFVICDNCKARIGKHKDNENAIELWNTRTKTYENLNEPFKRCPCCGSEAEMISQVGCLWSYCKKCKLMGPTIMLPPNGTKHTSENVIWAWNHRYVIKNDDIRKYNPHEILKWGSPFIDDEEIVDLFDGRHTITAEDIILDFNLSKRNILQVFLRPEFILDEKLKELSDVFIDRVKYFIDTPEKTLELKEYIDKGIIGVFNYTEYISPFDDLDFKYKIVLDLVMDSIMVERDYHIRHIDNMI